MKTLQRQLLAALAFLFLCAAGVSARAQVRTYMAYVGAYSAGTTYNLNDVVTASGVAYISLTSGNIGNTPATSTSSWATVGSSGGGGTTYTGTAPIGVAGSVISVAVGTGSGTVAAGNDSRITGAVQGAAVSSLTTGLMAVTNGNPVPRNGTGADITAALGYTPATSSTLPAGATADYNFLQGSGTSLVDQSGSGNNGTLGTSTLAPTWTTTGLQFSGQQQVTLPSALNGTQTFFFAIYINPLTAGPQPGNDYPVLLGSSLGVSGLNIMYVATDAAGNLQPLTYGPTIFNGGVSTSGVVAISGFHVLAVVLGTSSGNLDKFYLDGAEVAQYANPYHNAGVQSSGNFFLGSSNVSPYASSGFLGTMYRARLYPSQLTAGQVQFVSGAIRNEVYSRGVPVTPTPVVAAAPQFHAVGDSITFGQGATTPWPTLLSLTNQPTYNFTNWGISGVLLAALNGSEANRVALKCPTTLGPSVATVFAGTNDLTATGAAGVTKVLSAMASEIQTLKAAGCKVFVGTMISRTGTVTGGAAVDSVKDIWDAILLSQAKALGADGVIDFAADPLMGADGANTNTTYFQAGDNIHPTNVGHGRLANAASNTLNRYFGSTLANPNVVTTTAYQMLSSDGAVTAAPAANAAYTMPDCVGPSGETYLISNPQSAFTLSVVGKSGQPINGLTSAITIPSNSTVVLRDVPNPKATSGCHWVM